MNNLYYNTVSPRLLSTLQFLMKSKEFDTFRLVGGTSLSLQLGHRASVDIDLFSDSMYGSIDFEEIDRFLNQNFRYVDSFICGVVGMGKTFYIGDAKDKCIKLDLYYTDPFIQPVKLVDGIRLASIEEIIAMKIEVFSKSGRKKDFWDIHELIDDYSIQKMLDLHLERYPYSHNRKEILENFVNFTSADNDYNPICFRGKFWEVIKLDIVDKIKEFKSTNI